MNISVIITGIFGAFTIFGGIMGYVKASSTASLIAGSVSGSLLLLASFLITKDMKSGIYLGLAVSVLLLGRFGPSLFKQFKVMPNLVVVLLAITTIIILITNIKK